MKCPKCNGDMKVVKEDISKNFDKENPKDYNRTVYHCEADDIWINLEIPTK